MEIKTDTQSQPLWILRSKLQSLTDPFYAFPVPDGGYQAKNLGKMQHKDETANQLEARLS